MFEVDSGAAYEVWLCSDVGQRLRLLDRCWFWYASVVSGIGTFEVILDGDSLPESLLEVDRQVQIWRRHRGQKRLDLDFVGFLRKWKYKTEGATTYLTLAGPDVNDLLLRRIVAYAAGSHQASITSLIGCDDGMKDVVNENLLAGAVDGRNLTDYGASVQNDLGDGPGIVKSFSWRLVFTVLTEIAAAARQNGNEVFFGIVPTHIDTVNDQVALQFRTWTGQPGIDRTWPDGDKPVVFGIEYGNLTDPELVIDHEGEVNYVYAGGQGEGSNREVVEVSDSTRIARSVWNRREGFKDSRNESSTAGVTAAGNAMLAEKRPRERFTGKLVDTAETPYGSGWRLGDKVSVSYRGRQFDDIIRARYIRVTSQGQEEIKGSFDGGNLVDDPRIQAVIRKQVDLARDAEARATQEEAKFKGNSASDFTTATLIRHMDMGCQTTANQVQINFNGAIRKMATTA